MPVVSCKVPSRSMTSRSQAGTRSTCTCFCLCNAFPSSLEGVGNGLEDVPIDSDYSSWFVIVKSLRLSKFDSCQFKVCSVRGNLAKCYKEWEKIGASGFILSVIRNGYKTPFIDFPPPKVFPNNASALNERDFVSEAISDLLANRCVEVLDYSPAIANPLSVSFQSSGKKRLILDLRHVNLYIFKPKI